jgi:hypothetical protein
MTRFRSLLLAALLGGLAIHGALVACAGSGTAGAQTTSCQQWAVYESSPSGLSQTGPGVTTSAGTASTYLAATGCEPIGSVGSNYLFRKCVQ